MTKPDKSKRRGGKADAGLDGEASRRVRMLAAGAIPNIARERPEVLRALVGQFMKHRSVR